MSLQTASFLFIQKTGMFGLLIVSWSLYKGGNMNRSTSFILGALIGAIVGSAAAMLLAPASGESLRQQMQDYVKNIEEQVQQAAGDRRAELEAELANLRAPKTKTED